MNNTKKLVDTLTYSAGNDVEVDLPKEGIITSIDLETSITASGAAAAALSVMGLWRVIQNLKVQGGGGKNYFGMSGTQMGMLLHFLNLVDHPGTTWREIVATTTIINFRLHFGSRPRDIFGNYNPFDLSAGIPALDETNLKLTWTCCASDDTIDDTLTVSSGTMRVLVNQVLLTPPEWAARKQAGFYVPVSSSESYDPGATKSDLQGQRDIPTGNWVRRIAILAVDATAGSSNGPLLKDDQMTEVGVWYGPESRWLCQMRAKALELQNPVLDGMQVVDTPNTISPHNPTGGLYLLDMRKWGESPLLGLDAGAIRQNVRAGDFKLGMTIGAYSSSEKEHIWYDQLQRYSGMGI